MNAANGKTVIILIDALGWEIAQKYAFCSDLLPRSGPLDTVLGYSSAAIPSLLSGEPPSRHGAWAMYRYAPERSPFKWLRAFPQLPHALEWRMRVFTRWLTDRRRAIRGYYDLYDIPLRFLSYFDVAQRGDPYTPGGMDRETLFDSLVARGVDYKLWTYRTAEAGNFEALMNALDSDCPMLFLYTAELDALMHRVGIFDSEVEAKLREYERHVAAIMERHDLTVYLFSDHGMTDVSRVVDVAKEVERWGYRPGSDVVAFYDSTMARFWCRPELREELIERLNGTGWGRVVSESELEAYGCHFDDNAYGDVIFLVSPGGLIVPSFMGREAINAMHGYDPDDPFSKGCFMTNERSAALPSSILDLKDYLLERILQTT
jgi:predicted AlkP superfamily pyrophosphatase or phosphodiesterase